MRDAGAISYSTLHGRIRRARGFAADYPCGECGDQAAEWAYDNADPDERFDITTGCPFSLDIGRYSPLCLRCHRSRDANQPMSRRFTHPRRRTAPVSEIAARLPLGNPDRVQDIMEIYGRFAAGRERDRDVMSDPKVVGL